MSHPYLADVARGDTVQVLMVGAVGGFDKKKWEEVQLNLLLILPTAKRLNKPISIAVPTGVMEGTRADVGAHEQNTTGGSPTSIVNVTVSVVVVASSRIH